MLQLPERHENQAQALSYTLDYMETFAREELRELTCDELQDLAHGCTLLAAWAEEVFDEIQD